MSLVGLSHELGGATPFSALGVDMAPFGFAHFDRASSRRYEEQKCKPADRLALTQQMGPIAWNIIVGHRREIAPLLGFAGKRADLFARCRVGAPSLRRRVIQHHAHAATDLFRHCWLRLPNRREGGRNVVCGYCIDPLVTEQLISVILEGREEGLRFLVVPSMGLGSMSCVHRFLERRSELAIALRSEEHTSELQSLMRISYAVFCLKKKTRLNSTHD